jgi:hypothetical protein
MVFDFLRTLARAVENGVREKFSKNVNISWSTSNGSGSGEEQLTETNETGFFLIPKCLDVLPNINVCILILILGIPLTF